MGYTRTNHRFTYGYDQPCLSVLVSELQAKIGFVEALELIKGVTETATKVHIIRIKLASIREQEKNERIERN